MLEYIVTNIILIQTDFVLIIFCLCSYDLVQPADGQWGAQDKSGNWTGIVGELQRKVM